MTLLLPEEVAASARRVLSEQLPSVAAPTPLTPLALVSWLLLNTLSAEAKQAQVCCCARRLLTHRAACGTTHEALLVRFDSLV